MIKICKKCGRELDISCFSNNTIYKNKRYKRPECKDCVKEYNIKYSNKNRNKLRINSKKYYYKNKKKVLLKRKNNRDKISQYERKKYMEDTNFRIASLLRRSIRKFLKRNQRQHSSLQLLDCSLDFLKNHLQETAIKNGYLDFNINNYSGKEYHIDHIVPCSAFNLKCSYHQRLCFNWKNLQILDKQANLEKNNMIIL